MVGGQYGFQHVLVIIDDDTITVADADGVVLIEHTRPAPGTTYIGNGRPRGPRPNQAETSPKS
jgi:putative transposase